MAIHEQHALVNQVTLHKLTFVRDLLKSKQLHSSGTRDKVRERCLEYLDEGKLTVEDFQSLLEPLEMWGNQRIRLVRFDEHLLNRFSNREAVIVAVQQNDLQRILDSKLPVAISEEITPLSIRYGESAGRRLLTLVGGKMRLVEVPADELGDKMDEAHPDVVWRPFRTEQQKVVSFAEIDLDSGLAMISTKLLRQGAKYTAEFGEFFWAFEPFISLSDADLIPLVGAVYRIFHTTQAEEVRIYNQKLRDAQGGTMDTKAHSSRADVRQHNLLNAAIELFGDDTPGYFCNCRWQQCQDLCEEVHTNIHGQEGEITI